MAMCKMEMVAVGRDLGLECVCGRQDAVVSCAKPQLLRRAMMRSSSSQKRWPLVCISARRTADQTTCPKLPRRCNAIPAGGINAEPPRKSYDINEVLEKVITEEENEIPADQKGPAHAPEGEASPFTPADENTDDVFADEADEAGSMMPSQTATPSPKPASSSIGDGLGVSEQSALASDPVGGSNGKRDWRVHASSHGLDAILEHEGGNSVDDYKLRAHIFEESAVFFTALKNKDGSSVV